MGLKHVPPVSGSSLSAVHVKAAIDAYRSDSRSAMQADCAPLDSLRSIAPPNVKVTFMQPYMPMLSRSAGHDGCRIFSTQMLSGDALRSRAVGTGSDAVDSYTPSGIATHKRNPTCFKNGLPYLDTRTLGIITQNASAISAFESSQVDMVRQIDCANAQQIRTQRKASRCQKTSDSFPGGCIAVNTTHPPFSDARVRQALSMAINRKAENDACECGEDRRDQLIPTGACKKALPIDQLGAASKYWNFDPAAARRLLVAAGFANGFDATLVYTPQYGQPDRSSAERAIADMQAVGIRAKPQSVQYNQWISSVYRPPFNFQGILWGPIRYYSDVDPYLWYWLNPDPKQGISNQPRVNDPAILPLLQQQRQTLDPAARLKVIGDIQKIVADQQYYIGRTTGNAYTFWPGWLEGWSSRLGYDDPQVEQAGDSRK